MNMIKKNSSNWKENWLLYTFPCIIYHPLQAHKENPQVTTKLYTLCMINKKHTTSYSQFVVVCCILCWLLSLIYYLSHFNVNNFFHFFFFSFSFYYLLIWYIHFDYMYKDNFIFLYMITICICIYVFNHLLNTNEFPLYVSVCRECGKLKLTFA